MLYLLKNRLLRASRNSRNVSLDVDGDGDGDDDDGSGYETETKDEILDNALQLTEYEDQEEG